MSRSNFLECNNPGCGHRISYKPELIGMPCRVNGCSGEMFIHITDNPVSPETTEVKLATFKRKYGRRDASLILRQAISASQCGEHLDTEVQADILTLANELDELCGD